MMDLMVHSSREMGKFRNLGFYVDTDKTHIEWSIYMSILFFEWSILYVGRSYWPVWKRNGPFPVYNLDFRSSDFRSLFLILVVWWACSKKSSSSNIYKPCNLSSCFIRKFISKYNSALQKSCRLSTCSGLRFFYSSSVQFSLVHIISSTWYGPYDITYMK